MTTAGTPNVGMTNPTEPTAPYKLRRARKGRMLAGVAQGLATASGLDVTVVRICIGASLLSGLGFVGYILLWIVMPEEQPSRGRYVEEAPEQTARVIRFALAGAALVGVLKQVGVFWPFDSDGHNNFGFDGLLALMLLSIGVGVLVSRYRSEAWSTGETGPTAPPPGESFVPWTAPTATPPTDNADVDFDFDNAEAGHDPDHVTFVGPMRDVAHTVHRDVTEAIRGTYTDPGRAAEKRPGGAALGWARVVGWLVLLWWIAGLLVLLGLWRFDAVDITGPALLFGVAWVAFTVVLNALIRVRRAPVLLATLLALLVPVGMAQGMVAADGPGGSRVLRPLTPPAVSNYRQSVGNLELDFTGAQLATSRPTRINARMGTGRIAITVPDNVSLTVVARVEAGGYDVVGKRTTGGIGQRETLRFEGCAGAPHVQLFLRGGAGWIHVQRASGGNEPTCETPVLNGATTGSTTPAVVEQPAA